MDTTVFVHCGKCKEKTETSDIEMSMTKTGRPILKGVCRICGSRKNTFVKMNGHNQECKDDLFESY